jgi:general secretion pathway protein K
MKADMKQKRSRQSGVAIVAALLLVALVTVLAAQWLAKQNALGRAVEVQRNSFQARWLLTAATDWARVILREDTDSNSSRRNNYDGKGDIWTVPLARTHVTDASGRLEAYVSGGIEDAQGRFNLADLVSKNQIDEEALARFTRLCVAAGANSSQARAIATQVLQRTPKVSVVDKGSAPPEKAPGAAEPPAPAENPPQPGQQPIDPVLPIPSLRSITELPATEKVDANTLALLDPHVTVYARASGAPSTINVNTAGVPALASIAPEINQSMAQAIVAKREQLSFFKDVADFKNNFPALNVVTQIDKLITTQSAWFLAVGRIEHGRIDIVRQALINRPVGGGAATLVWSRDL